MELVQGHQQVGHDVAQVVCLHSSYFKYKGRNLVLKKQTVEFKSVELVKDTLFNQKTAGGHISWEEKVAGIVPAHLMGFKG